MISGNDRNIQPIFGIEYKGELLRLGNRWPDICNNIDQKIHDKKEAVSLKLCLFERLKSTLQLTQADLEPILEAYSHFL